jgi:hypothetical protein
MSPSWPFNDFETHALSEFDATDHLDADGRSLWPTLLKAEQAAQTIREKNAAKYTDPLIGVRVVGWLLVDLRHYQQALGSDPYRLWRLKISSCCVSKPGETLHPPGSDEETQAIYQKIFDLGLTVRNCMFRVCEFDLSPVFCNDNMLVDTVRQNVEHTTEGSGHTSRPSFDTLVDRLVDMGSSGPGSYSKAKEMVCVDLVPCPVSLLLLQALLRDSFKCVVTGGIDFESSDMVKDSEDGGFVATEVAHLFSQTAQENGTVSS